MSGYLFLKHFLIISKDVIFDSLFAFNSNPEKFLSKLLIPISSFI